MRSRIRPPVSIVRNDIFDVRRDRSDWAASRCGTYDLVTHVRRVRALVSGEIHRRPWPVAIRARDGSDT
jgi:hypothetical protein